MLNRRAFLARLAAVLPLGYAVAVAPTGQAYKFLESSPCRYVCGEGVNVATYRFWRNMSESERAAAVEADAQAVLAQIRPGGTL